MLFRRSARRGPVSPAACCAKSQNSAEICRALRRSRSAVSDAIPSRLLSVYIAENTGLERMIVRCQSRNVLWNQRNGGVVEKDRVITCAGVHASGAF